MEYIGSIVVDKRQDIGFWIADSHCKYYQWQYLLHIHTNLLSFWFGCHSFLQYFDMASYMNEKIVKAMKYRMKAYSTYISVGSKMTCYTFLMQFNTFSTEGIHWLSNSNSCVIFNCNVLINSLKIGFYSFIGHGWLNQWFFN